MTQANETGKGAAAVTPAQAIAVLIIRIWAIQKFVTTAFNIGINRDVLATMKEQEPDQVSAIIAYLSYNGLFLLLAILAFFFAGPVVRFLLRWPSSAKEQYRFSIDDLVRAGAFLIGLYLLGSFGSGVIYELMHDAISSHYRNVPSYMAMPGGYVSYLAHIFVIVFALWLVVFPGHVTRLFSWLRKAGEDKPAPAGET